ncbi:MAG: SDR family NAD(P)-dependent oxidoreductase [Oscillospiraceae bacterium]|nr:SDR family NAD(P)-dependent oxidoreductase [Oscillospiraceae bacterium]
MKIAIVTGASSGIGRQFALRAARESIDMLWVVARREDRLKELQAILPIPVRPFVLDLERRESVECLERALRKEKPTVTLLVNAAGFCKFGKTAEQSRKEISGMLALNVAALTLITQAVLPFMRRGGRIVQVASTAAFQPLPGMNVYAASKAYVLSYSRALNRELKPRGITVTAVCPGWTRTEFFDVAKQTENPREVSRFPLMSRAEDVARKALNDSRRGKDISVCGLHNRVHRLGAKLLPHRLIMAGWERMKN